MLTLWLFICGFNRNVAQVLLQTNKHSLHKQLQCSVESELKHVAICNKLPDDKCLIKLIVSKSHVNNALAAKLVT